MEENREFEAWRYKKTNFELFRCLISNIKGTKSNLKSKRKIR